MVRKRDKFWGGSEKKQKYCVYLNKMNTFPQPSRTLFCNVQINEVNQVELVGLYESHSAYYGSFRRRII